MARSKGAKARRNREQQEQSQIIEKVSAEQTAPIVDAADLFQAGEVLSREEIEDRIGQSGLVKRSDDEFFRLIKLRVFKQYKGTYIVR